LDAQLEASWDPIRWYIIARVILVCQEFVGRGLRSRAYFGSDATYSMPLVYSNTHALMSLSPTIGIVSPMIFAARGGHLHKPRSSFLTKIILETMLIISDNHRGTHAFYS
jgi:hypothetical protein